jgi:hypothetical protein
MCINTSTLIFKKIKYETAIILVPYSIIIELYLPYRKNFIDLVDFTLTSTDVFAIIL